MDSIRPSPTPSFALPRQATVWAPFQPGEPFSLPLMCSRVAAGFPSPADDYIEQELDIARLLVTNPLATRYVRIEGQSLAGHWIRPGDIAVVDTSLEAKAGMVIIAVLDGELVAKQLGIDDQGRALLIPSNHRYKTIVVQPEQDFSVWGVVTWTIHKQRP